MYPLVRPLESSTNMNADSKIGKLPVRCWPTLEQDETESIVR
jgi:hypothetical protein